MTLERSVEDREDTEIACPVWPLGVFDRKGFCGLETDIVE